MRKLLALAASVALALPAVSNADGGPPPRHPGNGHGPPSWSGGGEHHGDRDHDYRGGHDDDRDHRSYGYPRYYPRYYPSHGTYGVPYYGGGGRHHHDGDNDDALWAIGGLIVGAVIGTAVQKQEQAKQNSSVPAGPPSGCRDTVVYDSDGTPRVQRDCN